jgi:hypothetical protein
MVFSGAFMALFLLFFFLTGEMAIRDNWHKLKDMPARRDRHRLTSRLAYVLNPGL